MLFSSKEITHLAHRGYTRTTARATTLKSTVSSHGCSPSSRSKTSSRFRCTSPSSSCVRFKRCGSISTRKCTTLRETRQPSHEVGTCPTILDRSSTSFRTRPVPSLRTSWSSDSARLRAGRTVATGKMPRIPTRNSRTTPSYPSGYPMTRPAAQRRDPTQPQDLPPARAPPTSTGRAGTRQRCCVCRIHSMPSASGSRTAC